VWLVLFSVFCVHFPSANNQQQNATTWIRMGGVGGWGRDQGPPDTWPDVFETFCTQNYLQIFYFLRLFSLSIGAFATPTPPDWH